MAQKQSNTNLSTAFQVTALQLTAAFRVPSLLGKIHAAVFDVLNEGDLTICPGSIKCVDTDAQQSCRFLPHKKFFHSYCHLRFM